MRRAGAGAPALSLHRAHDLSRDEGERTGKRDILGALRESAHGADCELRSAIAKAAS
jgi:hypothetical protein